MLTTREIDVLRLLSSGCTYKKVGTELDISTHTVGSHVKAAYRKLEVHSAAAAVMRAVQLGLLPAPAAPVSHPSPVRERPVGLAYA